jgi:hypothetical protein
MSAYVAEYFRPRRRPQGIPAWEPKFPRQSTEPRLLEQLPWPRNLFGELASIAELMAESENAADALPIPQIESAHPPARG